MSEKPDISSEFLADLRAIYATLRSRVFSPAFQRELAQVHGTLTAELDDHFTFLEPRFDKWRRVTQELVRTRRARLDKETDPLLCPISLFRTMDYGRLETAHTRALVWLLDPKGEHGFGSTLIAAFLRRLHGSELPSKLQVDLVESEFAIDGLGQKGRLDILAEGTWGQDQTGWVLVIEAKVDSWEGENQLQKYDSWLRRRAVGRHLFRVFLTPQSQTPGPGAEAWEPLSFLELVRIFRPAYGGLRDAPGFHFLRFYLAGVLQDVCQGPRPCDIEEDSADPYMAAHYLRTVHGFGLEDTSHDPAR